MNARIRSLLRESNRRAQQRYYQRHKAEVDARCKDWIQANRARVKARAHEYYLRRKTGTSPDVSDAELDRRALEMLQKEGHR
jgi:hypothetical protein